MTEAATPERFVFRRRHRLSRGRDYQAVFGARMSSRHGPLVIYTRPNDLGHCRLGLSVGKRVGGAVRRNAVKRRLREAFRLEQGRVADGLDVVVTVQAHDAAGMERYREAMGAALERAGRLWEKRRRRSGGDEPERSDVG